MPPGWYVFANETASSLCTCVISQPSNLFPSDSFTPVSAPLLPSSCNGWMDCHSAFSTVSPIISPMSESSSLDFCSKSASWPSFSVIISLLVSSDGSCSWSSSISDFKTRASPSTLALTEPAISAFCKPKDKSITFASLSFSSSCSVFGSSFFFFSACFSISLVIALEIWSSISLSCFS